MVEPRVVPRAEHTLSRRDVDPDALKVLYRLKEADHIAYLVGGSVRDLLLGRRPKDFDIGTSAHPPQVKKLFRNCWIIGRRFRLAHVKFGQKVIEVATFRRLVQPGEEVVHEGVDNSFGTPEEDAFRRDFTINALVYDIATFSVIDYVDGLEDLRAGVVRSIGDPEVRFLEDPVRMMRAVALAARLDFTIDEPILEAIRLHRREIAKASPARLLEEYYKILRAGSAEKTFRRLAEVGLLEPVSMELHRGAEDPLWRSLAAIDSYRRSFEATPDTFTNPVLLGSLIGPIGLIPSGAPRQAAASPPTENGRGGRRREPKEPVMKLGELPLARRDVERLGHVLGMQRRLRDLTLGARAKRALSHRHNFREALTWLEIHGEAPELVEAWKVLAAEAPQEPAEGEPAAEGEPLNAGPPEPLRRRRRRRRRPAASGS